MKRKFPLARLLLLYLFLVVTSLQVARESRAAHMDQDPKPAQTGEQAAKTGETKTAPKPRFTLSVKTEPILNISLKAEKAMLAEIGESLSKKLKVPVFVGPGLKSELISTEFSELTLEPAVQLLAPSVYVDYEIRTAAGELPRPLGIFLYAANHGEPPLTAVVSGSNQSLLIEGDTEDGVEPANEDQRKREEEQPLRISYVNGLLSVKAKKQPLVLVLLKIGEYLGVPVDIQNETEEIVDVELNKMPVEEVVRVLSPNIQLFLRADLTRSDRRALRIALPMPATEPQQH